MTIAMNPRNLIIATVGLSIGFLMTLTTLVIPALLTTVRERGAAEAAQQQAAFVARQQREAAAALRIRSIEARTAEIARLRDTARKAVEASLSGLQGFQFDRVRITQASSGTFVCGEVTARNRIGRDVGRTRFIYSAVDDEVAIDPGQKNFWVRSSSPEGSSPQGRWLSWQERVAC